MAKKKTKDSAAGSASKKPRTKGQPATEISFLGEDEGPCPTKGPAKALWELRRTRDRIVKGKLGWVDPAILASRRSKDGTNVNDYILKALQDNHLPGATRKNLDTDFWITFFAEFQLAAPGFPGLPKLSPQDINLPDFYWEVMSTANHENPVRRDCGPWCTLVGQLEDVD